MITTTRSLNAWVTSLNHHPDRRLRLFCFPYAGGGTSIFRTWVNNLPASIEICALQLPGRESRLAEEPFSDMVSLVQELSEAISPYLDVPFAFFGHSMGAIVSFELARLLQKQYGKSPKYLFVSGRQAPHIPDPKPPFHHLSEVEFLAEIRRLNGTPEVVLQNAELMELLLPTLRADIKICETYLYTSQDQLNCPISAFGGKLDAEVGYQDLAGWSEHTSDIFTMRILYGHHFFLHSEQEMLLQSLYRDLQGVLA